MMALTGSVDEDSSLRDSDTELLSSEDEDCRAITEADLDCGDDTADVSAKEASSAEHLHAEVSQASKPSRA